MSEICKGVLDAMHLLYLGVRRLLGSPLSEVGLAEVLELQSFQERVKRDIRESIEYSLCVLLLYLAYFVYLDTGLQPTLISVLLHRSARYKLEEDTLTSQHSSCRSPLLSSISVLENPILQPVTSSCHSPADRFGDQVIHRSSTSSCCSPAC